MTTSIARSMHRTLAFIHFIPLNGLSERVPL